MPAGITALKGLRVLLTRPVEQSGSMQAALVAAGAIPLLYPTITTGPPPSWNELDRAMAELEHYDWVLFSSASAVRHTLSRLAAPPLLAQHGRMIGAVGEATARVLSDAGVRVDLVPQESNGAGLAAALSNLKPGTRVLFPQTIGGRPEVEQALRSQGCLVDVVPASRTQPVVPLPALPAFDVATFASPSALRAFLAQHPAVVLHSRPLIVIGPSTAAEAYRAGLEPRVARTPTPEGFMTAIIESL